MSKRTSLVTLFAAMILAGAGLYAQSGSGDQDVEAGKRWLAMMNHQGDTDKTISKKEFDRYMNEQFDLADTDHDGTLDAKELGHLRATLMAK
jgi:hypothetical protein